MCARTRWLCTNDKRGGDAASGAMDSHSNLKYRTGPTPGNKCPKHEPETSFCCSGHKIPGKRGNFGPHVEHAEVSGGSFGQLGETSVRFWKHDQVSQSRNRQLLRFLKHAQDSGSRFLQFCETTVRNNPFFHISSFSPKIIVKLGCESSGIFKFHILCPKIYKKVGEIWV